MYEKSYKKLIKNTARLYKISSSKLRISNVDEPKTIRKYLKNWHTLKEDKNISKLERFHKRYWFSIISACPSKQGMRRHSKFLSSKTTITPIAVTIKIIDIEKLKININHSFDPIQIS